MRLIFSILHFVFCVFSQAQTHTVGLLSSDSSRVFKGYNLLYPDHQPNVYLLNNLGEIVHTWTDTVNVRPSGHVHLLQDGSIIKTKKYENDTASLIRAAGGGGIVEKRSWDNELLWSFMLNDSFNRLHHDVEPMPNGNILMLCWEKKTAAEAVEKGMDPASIMDTELWVDKVMEVQPMGKTGFKIVWEWHVWDHLIQNFDSALQQYGEPSDFPEKIDINYAQNNAGAPWAFANSVSYNPGFDQIALGVPTFNEIWIVDHTTNTAQAATSAGGYANKGGDLLFRWGNPAAYASGGSNNQKLFFPNHVQWIDKNWGESNFGKLMVFNNRAGQNHSTTDIIFPTLDTYFWEFQKTDGTNHYLPTKSEWTYKHPDSTISYSSDFSSAQRLPNGNTLICAAEQGYSYEVTNAKEIVWEYRTPLRYGARVKQGESVLPFENSTMKISRYAIDFPAFSGRDLTPKGFLEIPDSTDGLENSALEKNIIIFPNSATTAISIISSEMLIDLVTVYSITGKIMLELADIQSNEVNVDLSLIPPGTYYVSVNHQHAQKVVVVK